VVPKTLDGGMTLFAAVEGAEEVVLGKLADGVPVSYD
jgi:hypothetical protein